MKTLADCKVGKDFRAECRHRCSFGSAIFAVGNTYLFNRVNDALSCYMGEEMRVSIDDYDFNDNFKVV